jgi:hypothetical protein
MLKRRVGVSEGLLLWVDPAYGLLWQGVKRRRGYGCIAVSFVLFGVFQLVFLLIQAGVFLYRKLTAHRAIFACLNIMLEVALSSALLIFGFKASHLKNTM